jgi:hypothetical protein
MRRFKIVAKQGLKRITFVISAIDEKQAEQSIIEKHGHTTTVLKVDLLYYYVTMTDKFMSGWGKAEGKINKYVIRCTTLQEAETIEQNAKRRPEMKHINIVDKLPYYSPERYVLSLKTFDELGTIWKRI